MKCVVRQECKCHGRLVARETEFCKVAPNVNVTLLWYVPLPLTNKLLINSYALNIIFQITVRFRSHCRNEGLLTLLYLTLLIPRVWSGCWIFGKSVCVCSKI
jgi:hypothetical protein